MKRNATYALLAMAMLITALFCGADWMRFHGPSGDAVADDKGLPTDWTGANVAWKTALPGFGSSSPITVGDKIFITAYSGYGLDKEKPGKQDALTRHLICVDRGTGKIVWEKSVKADLPEAKYGGFLLLHGYASSTPVSDGASVYVFYGRAGVYAYNMAGDELWHKSVGSKTHVWGSAASPILVGDLVIVNASVESEAVVALNKTTGDEVWRVGGIRQSWATPALLHLPDGSQELVVSGHSTVLGIEPATGKELWSCAGVPDYVCPSVITHGDVAYVSGGRKQTTMAIRGGGRGDVSKSHKLWEQKKCSLVPTPVFYDGRLYNVTVQGVAYCLKADDGSVVYEARVPDFANIYASPVLADGKIYAVSREKGAVVLAAGDKFKELGRGRLDDSSVFDGTPVPSDGKLLIRSDRFLYCIGK